MSTGILRCLTAPAVDISEFWNWHKGKFWMNSGIAELYSRINLFPGLLLLRWMPTVGTMRPMTRLRYPALMILVSVVVLVTVGLWWAHPRQVDMAAYAPADSLLYLEANNPAAVLDSIAHTDAWRLLTNSPQERAVSQSWIQRFVRLTGIGPIESVLLARSQVAVVVKDVGTTEEGSTLRLRPLAAVIIDSHTSKNRTRQTVAEYVKRLAVSSYDKPTFRVLSEGNVDSFEWGAPQGSRQIVVAMFGTLIIIGNDQRVVQSCLDAARGRETSLRDDAELHRARSRISGTNALTFGYVPASNSAKLLSISIPLFFGNTPADPELQRLINKAAAKVFGSLSWSCRAYRGGIEDKYLLSVDSTIISNLKDNITFSVSKQQRPFPPAGVYSATYYQLSDPHGAWQNLRTSVSSRVDALSAIFFSSVLKSALLSYGISDPEAFLRTVNGELITFRFDDTGERAILVAEVRDSTAVRALLTSRLGFKAAARDSKVEWFDHDADEAVGALFDNTMILGTQSDVETYSAMLDQATAHADDELTNRITFYVPPSSSSFPIVTYTNDSERIVTFAAAATTLGFLSSARTASFQQTISRMPYAATTTTMTDIGIERVTRSPLGQFSTLLPLTVPEQGQAKLSAQP
jgi:hypothetical protein